LGQAAQWFITATDDRFVGELFNDFSADLDPRAGFPEGRIWGTMWIEEERVRVWEGD
jgi:hypothetical protein